jgi:hypothetical protein
MFSIRPLLYSLMYSYLAKHFSNRKRSNAYESVSVPDARNRIGEEVKAAFGRTVRLIAPTSGKFDEFNGVNTKESPETLFVNAKAKINPVAIIGHQMLYSLRRERLGLYMWFRNQASGYMMPT